LKFAKIVVRCSLFVELLLNCSAATAAAAVALQKRSRSRLAPVVEVPIDNNNPFVQSVPRTLQASVHEEVMGAGIVVWIKHVTAHIRPRVLSDKLNAQALMRSAGKPAKT
jgi:hypothetical protein